MSDTLLFIDSNKYLDLYRTVRGKSLLKPLCEQSAHIFISQQVVDEVQRNKLDELTAFLNTEDDAPSFPIPDHLYGDDATTTSSLIAKAKEISVSIKQLHKDINAHKLSIVEKATVGKDAVSEALDSIFSKAVKHSVEELERARDRKERGNPPGKKGDPLGDQLSWEQLLTAFKGKRKLWIISRDGDYGATFKKKGFLKRTLYQELCAVSSNPEAYLFSELSEGLRHFVSLTGSNATLPSAKEILEISKEEQALPPYRVNRRFVSNWTHSTRAALRNRAAHKKVAMKILANIIQGDASANDQEPE